jgi:hypothetical protein
MSRSRTSSSSAPHAWSFKSAAADLLSARKEERREQLKSQSHGEEAREKKAKLAKAKRRESMGS